MQKMRNVDDGERVSAFDNQTVALRELSQHLAGTQHRQRQFSPRKSRGIEETPKIILGGALNFDLRAGKGCGV
jgi:hypothetical protein